jgi:hypothetical protein
MYIPLAILLVAGLAFWAAYQSARWESEFLESIYGENPASPPETLSEDCVVLEKKSKGKVAKKKKSAKKKKGKGSR